MNLITFKKYVVVDKDIRIVNRNERLREIEVLIIHSGCILPVVSKLDMVGHSLAAKFPSKYKENECEHPYEFLRNLEQQGYIKPQVFSISDFKRNNINFREWLKFYEIKYETIR